MDDVSIRLATPRDRPSLEHLARLDSSKQPAGPYLVAQVENGIVAAVPLLGGEPIADPFLPTADLVRLLELRAESAGARVRTAER